MVTALHPRTGTAPGRQPCSQLEADLRIVAGLVPANTAARRAAEIRVYRLAIAWAALYLRRRGRPNPDDEAADAVHGWWMVVATVAARCTVGRPLAPLLFAVLRRFANRAAWAGRRRLVPLGDLDVASDSPGLGDVLWGREDCRQLREALVGLPPKYRYPLLLKYESDLSAPQIAEVLHVSVGTVYVRICRGKAMLRELLRDLQP